MEGTSYGVAIMPNNLHSLVNNEDPWILRHGTHFSLPRPSKIQIRREAGGTKEAAGDGHPINGELQTSNCKVLSIEISLEDST
ncbi:Hypothetical predicted protein, partial [Olea europaea subsp. europaea]